MTAPPACSETIATTRKSEAPRPSTPTTSCRRSDDPARLLLSDVSRIFRFLDIGGLRGAPYPTSTHAPAQVSGGLTSARRRDLWAPRSTCPRAGVRCQLDRAHERRRDLDVDQLLVHVAFVAADRGREVRRCGARESAHEQP